MTCPYCSKELNEGEICTCQQGGQNNNEQNVPPQGTYFDPTAPQQQNYYNPETNYTYAQEPNTTSGTYYDPSRENGFYPPMPEYMPANTDYPQGYKVKKKYVAVILAASLGAFGIHNFYLGYSSKGIAQVLLTTVGSIFFGLGPVASVIWSLVEAVQLLTEDIDRDANNYKIRTIEEYIEGLVNKDNKE